MKRIIHWLKGKMLAMFSQPKVRSISMDPETLADISEMARGAHPKEMLAFLSSSGGNVNGHVSIDELQLQAYYASGDSASVMTSNLPMTTSIIGTVHSHPGGNTHPSEADRTLFRRFGYVHAIIGEPYRPQDIRFYSKNGEQINVEIQ